MAVHEYWMKRNHTALYEQVTRTVNYLSLPGNRDRMGLSAATPQGQYYDAGFMPVFETYLQAYVAWADKANRTPAITARFLTAEKALKKEYKELYNAFFKTNPLVTDEDLVEMALPESPSGERHPAPVATEPPAFDVDTSVQGRVTLHYYKKGGRHKKGKPAGQHGAEVAWMISDTPPARWDDLTHSGFDTSTPVTLSFENDQRGKTLYFALLGKHARRKRAVQPD